MPTNYSLTDYFGGNDTAAYKNYKEGQSSGKWSDLNDYISKGGSNSGSYSSQIKQAIDAQQQAIKPAVTSLQNTIPIVQQGYATQQQSLETKYGGLEEKYNSLLDQINNQQQQATTNTTKTQNNELAKRGILPSSGLYDQTLENALNPINTQFGGLIKDVGLAQKEEGQGLQDLIASLGDQQALSVQNIGNAIAQLQAGAGQSGIQNALQQAQQAAQQAQFNQSFGLQQSSSDLAKKIYETIQLPESQYAVNKPYYQPNSGGSDLSSILSILGLSGFGSYAGTGDWEPIP